MPLSLCPIGEENIIKRIGGRKEIRHHLENLGFTAGGVVKIISASNGNIIVNIKESRVAVSREMASKIIVGG